MEGKVRISSIQPPPAIVRLTPKAELVSEYRARFFKPLSAAVNIVGAEGGAEKGGSGARREGDWVHTAEADMEPVVVQEAALQRRVEAERVRLAAKVTERGGEKKTLRSTYILAISLTDAQSKRPFCFSLFHVQCFRLKPLLAIVAESEQNEIR